MKTCKTCRHGRFWHGDDRTLEEVRADLGRAAVKSRGRLARFLFGDKPPQIDNFDAMLARGLPSSVTCHYLPKTVEKRPTAVCSQWSPKE